MSAGASAKREKVFNGLDKLKVKSLSLKKRGGTWSRPRRRERPGRSPRAE